MIANDVLTDVSLRVLIEPVVNTTLFTAVPGVGTFVITPPDMRYIYNGAMLVVGTGATQEQIVATAVTPTTFTATFFFAHPGTDPVVGATFPTGQPTDILFTQAEMLGYLSDALADFTLKTWPIYNIVQSGFSTGVRAYSAPADAIRIERISRQDTGQNATTLGTAIPAPGRYTVSPVSMSGIANGVQLIVGTYPTQEIVVAFNVTATTFDAVFGFTHLASDALTVIAKIYRLWDVSVSDLDNLDPNWQGATQGSSPRFYYEDQLNVGQYGVYPLPPAFYNTNIWYSQRPPVNLTLLSPVFVPTPLAYIPYYGMLARIFRKDGEMRDSQREQYCQKRYDIGVEITMRFLEGLGAAVMPGPVQPQAGA